MPPSEYDKSQLFDVDKWSNDSRVNRLAKEVTKEIVFNFRNGYSRHTKRYDHVIKHVIQNLIKCFEHPHLKWVKIELNKSKFAVGTRYHKLRIPYRPFKNVIGALNAMGFIEVKKGHHFPKSKKSTRIRATRKLMELLPVGVKANSRLKPSNEIQLKDEDKNQVDYPETRSIRHNRRILARINAEFYRASIDIELSNELETAFYKKRGYWISTRQKFLHRVFNETFARGGRFYGPWWQGVGSEYRANIRINGEPVVELDYSCLHTRMLYDIECAQQPAGDMYLVEGFEHGRGLYKSILNKIWNAKTLAQALAAIRDDHNRKRRIRPTLKNADILELLVPLKVKHSAIIHYVGSGIGNDLQYLDSCISEKVMITMLNLGTVCLPVHDSFVVPWMYERQLREAMVREYANILGKEPVIDKK